MGPARRTLLYESRGDPFSEVLRFRQLTSTFRPWPDFFPGLGFKRILHWKSGFSMGITATWQTETHV